MSEPFWVPLGGAGVDYKGTFDPAVQYQSGDVVRYLGIDFLAVNPSLGTTPPIAGSSLVVPQILDRRASPIDITNIATELSLFDGAASGAATGWTIPAGVMGSDRMLRLTLLGDWLYNSGGMSLTARLKWGGTTIWQRSTSTTTVSGNRHPIDWVVKIANLGASNSQIVTGLLPMETADMAAPTTGIGLIDVRDINPGNLGTIGIATLAAVDTALEQRLDLSIQYGSASVGHSFRRRYACLELV